MKQLIAATAALLFAATAFAAEGVPSDPLTKTTEPATKPANVAKPAADATAKAANVSKPAAKATAKSDEKSITEAKSGSN